MKIRPLFLTVVLTLPVDAALAEPPLPSDAPVVKATSLTEDQLRQAIVGKTIYLNVSGFELPIHYKANGRMTGNMGAVTAAFSPGDGSRDRGAGGSTPTSFASVGPVGWAGKFTVTRSPAKATSSTGSAKMAFRVRLALRTDPFCVACPTLAESCRRFRTRRSLRGCAKPRRRSISTSFIATGLMRKLMRRLPLSSRPAPCSPPSQLDWWHLRPYNTNLLRAVTHGPAARDYRRTHIECNLSKRRNAPGRLLRGSSCRSSDRAAH